MWALPDSKPSWQVNPSFDLLSLKLKKHSSPTQTQPLHDMENLKWKIDLLLEIGHDDISVHIGIYEMGVHIPFYCSSDAYEKMLFRLGEDFIL